MRAPERTIRTAKRLRRAMTLPEIILWQSLRGNNLAHLRFRRQHPIGPYVLDFYCPAAQLCVEIDGRAHDSAARVERDAIRDTWLREQGIQTIRFLAADVLDPEGLEAVLKAIVIAAAPSTGFAGPPPP